MEAGPVPLTALGLLLVAAMMHTTWNLLVKRAKEKQVFIWCSLITGVIIFSPLLLTSPLFLISTWPFIISSALVEAIYYITLIRAYENGDFSLVYPMARGTAPAFLLIWATFFLGERPRLFGLIGISLLVFGLIIVGGRTWLTLRKTSRLSKSALALALGVACCISVYTAIDGAAVHHASPLPYTVLVIALTVLFITPAVVMRYGNTAIADEWRANWKHITLVGLFTLLAYILALKAYTIARVSYAGSVREISVVFASFVGWRWLGERFGAIRLVGAAFIFAGMLAIAFAG
ncbi:MAG TPA: EamA family transporter [Ktedonobacteraceae bacterium]|nr:EamA family transporter [Ktedonobacteraceae bacterium]